MGWPGWPLTRGSRGCRELMELFVQLSCQERGQRVALVVRVTGPPSLGLAVLLTAHMSLKPAQHCAFLVLFFFFIFH